MNLPGPCMSLKRPAKSRLSQHISTGEFFRSQTQAKMRRAGPHIDIDDPSNQPVFS